MGKREKGQRCRSSRKQQRALTYACLNSGSGAKNPCSLFVVCIKCLIIPLLMPNDDSDSEFPQELDRLAKVYAHMVRLDWFISNLIGGVKL